ncbi:MAG: hypothetical protein KBC62_04360 [Candidatus Pacebacteria bacterium]|nr:hypothetical protein [Candidatus Paceibacterota bacterium]MBP9843210.1 hypothetical protein [Candidatus Paceibacterota bacterium]
MESAPKFEGGKNYNLESVTEDVLEQALDAIEVKLDKNIEDATPEERIAVTSELLAAIETRGDDVDHRVAEVYARMRRLAELELSFQTEHEKLSHVLH